MRISLLQMDVALGKPARNQEKARRMIEDAMREKPDVIALPELWNTGFFPQNVKDLADHNGEETKALLGTLAKRHSVNIVGGSAANLERGQLFNTNYVFDRRGELISQYHKIHLFSPSGEHQRFQHGTEAKVFTLDGVKAGVIICYDVRFPELARMLALQGVELLFIPAAWPHPRLSHWQTLVKARAIENQIFVAAINGAGASGQMKLCGSSMLVDPWGEVLCRAEEDETMITREIELSVIKDIRERMHVLNDRKPLLYHN